MKRKIKSIISLSILFISIVGIVYSTLKIIQWKKNTTDNKELKEIINESVTIIEDKPEEEPKYIVDFETLKKQNSDTIAYLKVNNTEVDYVVVKGQDNDYYLNHNFNKDYNVAGWIFADYKNKFDGTDKNIVIYGHNMQDGSMFASLKEILTEKWQNNEKKQITLVTEKETLTYEIISSYSIEAEDYYIKTSFGNNMEYSDFLTTISKRSYYNYNINLNTSDKILTLSTCTGNGKGRIVIHAKQISTEENI